MLTYVYGGNKEYSNTRTYGKASKKVEKTQHLITYFNTSSFNGKRFTWWGTGLQLFTVLLSLEYIENAFLIFPKYQVKISHYYLLYYLLKPAFYREERIQYTPYWLIILHHTGHLNE